MKILILGNGAREQVLKENLSIKNTVYLDDFDDFLQIKHFCIDNNIEMVIPSTETYLCNGVVDFLQKILPGVKVFGPTRDQARIEGSKYFSKKLMRDLKIPTAYFQYIKDNLRIESLTNKVIKYSGLAKGKGVYLPDTEEESLEIINQLFKENKEDGAGIIIEDRLTGPEVSVMAFCNGKEAFLMPQIQDYKRIYDNDQGPNTGGMGAVGPVSILSSNEMAVVKSCMDDVVRHLNYKGILYAGVMKTYHGIFFLEFNCRFGDPEAQILLNLLDTDLLEIIENCISGYHMNISWKQDTFVAGVVLSHEDYPLKKLNSPIPVVINETVSSLVKCYHSNIIDDTLMTTTGGRVLTMVSSSNSLKQSLENVYNNIHKISFDRSYYRRDIGCNITNDVKTKIPLSIGVLASGNASSIDTILKKTDYIKVFITNKNSPNIFEKARENNIPCMFINPKSCKSKKEYYQKIVNILRMFEIDLVILSGFMLIVSDILYDEFETINIHPSLLPKYKGFMDLQLHETVLNNKEAFTGCTLHRVVKEIDGGGILAQKQLKIDDNVSSALELKQKVQVLEKQCLYEYVVNYERVKYDIDVNQSNEFISSLASQGISTKNFSAEFQHNNQVFGASADGCGTKLDLANENNSLDTIGIDLVAMNVNDLLAGGCKPLFFMDYIAIDKMNKRKCQEIVTGIIKGCEISKCKLIGGETAEMKGIYLKDKLDLAGFAIGEKKYDFPKKNLMNQNCFLYGLTSSGIHSNGYTLVKKLLKQHSYDMTEILTPTKIYMELLDLYEKYKDVILGVAHITGGGFGDNIKRMLTDHLYFNLDHWEFPEIFQWIQEKSNMTRQEMMNTFNCGYGIVLITNKEIEIGDKIGKLRFK